MISAKKLGFGIGFGYCNNAILCHILGTGRQLTYISYQMTSLPLMGIGDL